MKPCSTYVTLHMSHCILFRSDFSWKANSVSSSKALSHFAQNVIGRKFKSAGHTNALMLFPSGFYQILFFP